MPDQFTPNYSWTLPEIGASRDSWGAKWNANLTSIDQHLFMAMPIGTVLDYAGSQAPSGYLVCDGRAVSRTTYSALFAAIGTAWGVGDGSGTFNLPNLIGRSGVGPGTVLDQAGNSLTFTYGQQVGSWSNQILQAHLPNYALHTDVQGYHAHGGATVAAGGHSHTTDGQGSHSHGGATWAAGSHGHSGVTDVQGDHYHYTSLYGFAPATVGAYNVMAQTAGAYNYYTSTAGAHSHNLTVYAVADHAHTIGADGYHAHNVYAVSDHAHAIYGDGNHSHTIYPGGSSQWFPVLSPALVVTKIIFAGTQAAVRVMSMADTAPLTTIEGEATELLDIREELRQMRQLLAMMRGPAQQRRLVTPLRGPH